MKDLMKPLIVFLLLVFPLSAFASWSGPQVTIGNKNGRRVITICDQGGSCTSSTPFFLALNTQNTAIGNHDWTTFMYEAQLQLKYVSSSANGIVPMLQVHLLNTSDAFIDELASHLNQLSPRPYLYVRMYLETIQQPGMEKMKTLDMLGNLRDDTGGKGSPWALNETWLAYQEGEITRVLNRMDAQYPGRIMGLNIGYENGGEWFFRPYGYDDTGQMLDWGEEHLCGTGVNDGVKVCFLFPWTNDSGTQPGPSGRHYFFLEDYSSTSTTGFCNWVLLPSSLRTNCRAPDPVERNNAVPGQAMPQLGQARGVFLDPADNASLRAAYYNRYISEQNVSAIIRLLARAKQVSGNRVLTSTFYGYYYGLDPSLPITGHNALTSLLASSSIDILAAPYSYGESRQLDNAFSPQGLSDSPQVSNKLWFDEDDTRTHLACSPSCTPGAQSTNLWDSIRILRRNLLTTGIHGHGSYLFDLGTGWFGRTDMTSDSDTLWANLTNAFTAVNKIQMGAPNRFNAQVAVFVDDLSANYIAGITPAGDSSFGLLVDLYAVLEDNLSHLGTPIKHYLLSDLLNSNLDLSAIKLAILPNAFNVPQNLRQAIDTKLKTPGRTILFIYAAGYMSQDAPASVSSISAFTGINVSLGSSTPVKPVLSENFTINGQTISGGPSYPLTPWFFVNDSGATTDGRYNTITGAPVSLARKTIAVTGGSYTSILAAAPSLPLNVLRNISERAGVFHFVPVGDIVESSGNMLMVHAATTEYKTITFPYTMPRIFETALYPSDTLMCASCTQLSQLPFNDGDTRAFRWTSAPVGGFDVLSGASIQGWAADLDMPDTSVNVTVYLGGPMGAGTNMGTFAATVVRPDVNQYFGISGNHGFSFSMSSCPSGMPVYIYALDPEGQNGDGSGLVGSKTCQ
jgi:hypothetical protein